jgi:S1-C subfamily serine protease
MRTRLRIISAALLLAYGVDLLSAAELPADTQFLARKVESELTGVVTKASNAFAFVGGGSGVVISSDGYILTNHHVAGIRQVQRTTWTSRINGTGKFYVCDVAGTDPVGDLCLLKARDAHDLPYVEPGDINTLRIGQQCMTIGDPFKLADPLNGPPAVSLGTISLLHRFQQGYSDAIQTDAAINLGNSGGPLVTLDGKLIGITGQIMARFGVSGNTGIGYAIPIDQIERFLPSLKAAKGGVIYHGDFPQGAKFAESNGDEMQAVIVLAVEELSEAQNWGFRAGDKILEIQIESDPVKHTLERKPVLNFWRLRGIVQSYPENTPVTILVERGARQRTIPVTLARMPIPPSRHALLSLGMDEVDMARVGDGVLAGKVVPSSAAERAGMQDRDVLLKVDGQRPANAWTDLLLNRRPGERFTVLVRRATASGPQQFTLEFTAPPRE